MLRVTEESKTYIIYKHVSPSGKVYIGQTNQIPEAEHIKNSIWRYIGYTPQEDNDEVDAYLITYIYDKITSVFYKHDRAAR